MAPFAGLGGVVPSAYRPAVGYALAYLVVAPVATLAHEFGHAAVALATGDGDVRVQLGTDPTRRASIGRLSVAVDPRAPRQRWYGRCDYAAASRSADRVAAVSAAGPAASAVLLVGLWTLVGVAGRGVGYWALVGGVWWTAVQLVVTAVPVRYPRWFGPYAGTASDGRRVLVALRSRVGD